ncbi:MAG TPA: hypothetical protein VJY33_24435 [Isosphaeraceae bacterium]|nr:hypothetical protein [Isosphaeraceae bacterium]
MGRIARVVASLALGILIGVLFHYFLYRFSLPSKPFIYVTF